MSRKGNCWDNAPTESFFNSLKNERVHGTTYATRADAQADLFEYIEVFYNRSRRHSTLGYSSPVRFLEGVDQQAQRSAIQGGMRWPIGRRSSMGTSNCSRFDIAWVTFSPRASHSAETLNTLYIRISKSIRTLVLALVV